MASKCHDVLGCKQWILNDTLGKIYKMNHKQTELNNSQIRVAKAKAQTGYREAET